mmetsp:Transcript_30031/g.36817  ORF Transcript_30031/g.36817 Transcript_30031/m.36817 type:complete len:461 (-) Transcript_30031:14-1396(-)
MTNSVKEYTWQEVAKHNSKESAWVYIDDTVYDVTNFLYKHPGGHRMLLLMAGRDITDLFITYHPFTNKPQQMLHKFEIGKLKGGSEWPSFIKDSGFYKECREKVGKYFKDNNIDSKYFVPGMLRAIFIIFMIFGSWFLGYQKELFPLYYRVWFMVISGIFQGMLLIHIMHDCSHTAFSHNPFIWSFVGHTCLDVICGCSFDAWLHQHTVGHHVYTNVMCIDPDCPPIRDGDMRRIAPNQTYYDAYMYQYIYLPLLYCFYAFKNRIQDITQTLMLQFNGNMRVNPYFCGIKSALRLGIFKSLWIFRTIIIPLFIFKIPFFEWLLLFCCNELTTGYFLTYNFQVSHVSTDLQWPLPIKDNKTGKLIIPGEWAKLQVETTVDYGHKSFINTFFSGALNYQTIHHLFPSVSQYHYPKIRDIIFDICTKHNVKYTYYDTFIEAFYGHVRQLYDMSFKDNNIKKID